MVASTKKSTAMVAHAACPLAPRTRCFFLALQLLAPLQAAAKLVFNESWTPCLNDNTFTNPDDKDLESVFNECCGCASGPTDPTDPTWSFVPCDSMSQLCKKTSKFRSRGNAETFCTDKRHWCLPFVLNPCDDPDDFDGSADVDVEAYTTCDDWTWGIPNVDAGYDSCLEKIQNPDPDAPDGELKTYAELMRGLATLCCGEKKVSRCAKYDPDDDRYEAPPNTTTTKPGLEIDAAVDGRRMTIVLTLAGLWAGAAAAAA